METSQHLIFTESFSYSWLMNIKTPLDGANGDGLRTSLDTAAADGGSAFIDMDDPELFSKRWNAADSSLDFDFHLPAAQPDGALVHADQLIADGLLLPLHLVRPPPKINLAESTPAAAAADSLLLRSVSVDSSKSLLPRSNRFRSYHAAVPRRAVLSSSPSTLCAPLGSLPPSWRLGSARSSSASSCKEKKLFRFLCLVLLPNLYKRVKELVRKRRAVRSTASSAVESIASPRHSHAFYFSSKGVMVDTGAERAIYDAVLHCKNSFGKL